MAFIKKNLNPANKKVGDCAVRAVAAACNISWQDAFWGLTNVAFEMNDVLNDASVVEVFMISQGFKVGKVKVVKGSKRPTVRQFAEQNPDKVALLRVANHFTACAYGNYVDIWDCGDCCIYKYFYKQI